MGAAVVIATAVVGGFLFCLSFWGYVSIAVVAAAAAGATKTHARLRMTGGGGSPGVVRAADGLSVPALDHHHAPHQGGFQRRLGRTER